MIEPIIRIKLLKMNKYEIGLLAVGRYAAPANGAYAYIVWGTDGLLFAFQVSFHFFSFLAGSTSVI